MTNTTGRRGALLLLALACLAATLLYHHAASTEVVTVDDTTPSYVPTTTATASVPQTPVSSDESTTTVATVAPAEMAAAVVAAPTPPQDLQPAVRVEAGCTNDPVNCTPDDPLASFHGTFACRFATAGRVTPCCPDATKTLALFWSGHDLAVADYIVGREGGCREAVINSSGCVGWFQLCGWKCNGPCTIGYNNAEKARWLYDQFGWCSTGSWYLAGDHVTGRGGVAC